MDVYIGQVMHFYRNISVAVINLVESLSVGDTIHVKSPITHAITTDFEQRVTSMEIQHKPISIAESGHVVAIQMVQRVRPGDNVFKKVLE